MSKAVAVTAMVSGILKELREEVVFFYVRDKSDMTGNVVMQSGGNIYVFDVQSIIEVAQLAEPQLTTPAQRAPIELVGSEPEPITPDNSFMVTEAPLLPPENDYKVIKLDPHQRVRRRKSWVDYSAAKAKQAWTTREEQNFIAEIKAFGHYVKEPGGLRMLLESLAPKTGRSYKALRARFWKLTKQGKI